MKRRQKIYLALGAIVLAVGLASLVPALNFSSTIWQAIILSSIPAGANVDSTIHQIVCVNGTTGAIQDCVSTPVPTSTPTAVVPTATPTPGALIVTGSNIIPGTAASTDTFMELLGSSPTNSSATENNFKSTVGGVYTLKNLTCVCNNAPGGGVPGVTRRFFVRDNGVDTTLTCNQAAADTSCTDTTHFPVTVAAHMYDVRVFASPGATPAATPVPTKCSCSVGP